MDCCWTLRWVKTYEWLKLSIYFLYWTTIYHSRSFLFQYLTLQTLCVLAINGEMRVAHFLRVGYYLLVITWLDSVEEETNLAFYHVMTVTVATEHIHSSKSLKY